MRDVLKTAGAVALFAALMSLFATEALVPDLGMSDRLPICGIDDLA